MTVVLYYTSEENHKFREDLGSFGSYGFKLCWDRAQSEVNKDPLLPTPIYCNQENFSFKHLQGPILIIEQSALLDEKLISSLSQIKDYIIFKDTAEKELNWQEETPLTFLGILLPEIPTNFDTSSYQGFRAKLGQIAKEVFAHKGNSCLKELTSRQVENLKIEKNKNKLQKLESSNNPLVSVILPSFDRAEFLARSLASLECQTLEDFEVILISNNQPEIRDPRIKLIKLTERVSISKARNLGLEKAKGKYIAYLDDDDLYLTKHLELLSSILEKSNQKLAFSICARLWESEPKNQAIAYDLPFHNSCNWTELLTGNKMPTPAVMHRNQADFRFDENIECMEDWDLWLRVSKNSEIQFLPVVTSLFSRRPNISNISSEKKNQFDWYGLCVWAKHLNSELTKNLHEDFKNLITAHCQQIIIKNKTLNLADERKIQIKTAIDQLQSAGFIQTEQASQLFNILKLKDTKSFDASVVIPLYNGLQYTKALWSSILKVSTQLKLEYIFVDNASSDGTKEWLLTLGNQVKTIINSNNRNFAGACNQGAEAASSEIIIFLNNDTEVTEKWAEELISPLLNDPSLGAVGNKQIFPGTSRIHHAGIYIDLSGHPKHYLEGVEENDPRVNFIRECEAITAGCFSIRKNDFKALSGFFEGYKNGYEDVDLCVRLRKSGKRIIYNPLSRIYHHVSKSPGRNTHGESNWQLFQQRCMQYLNPDLSVFLRQNRENNC